MVKQPANIFYRISIVIFLFIVSNQLFCQTEFDSLKRNVNLDSSYQPSSKPTFVTDYAEVKISGFIQPAFYYDYNNIFDIDLFVTSSIPTDRQTDVKFNRFHFSANQSRLAFAFKFPKAKTSTSAYLEGDFLSSTTSQHAYFRLRHAYLTWGNFLAGQTWTNFGDVANGPNTLDLEGPNSMPASRVAQVRWSTQVSPEWNLLFAMEEPKSDYTPLDSASAIRAAIPEFVVKPKYQTENITWVNSFIYKVIAYTDKDYSFKKLLSAWGVTSSLSIKISDKAGFHPLGLKKKEVNLFGIIGSGTQGSVNDFGGLGFEAYPVNSTTLETLLYYGGYIAYSFVWNKRWASTYVYSYLHQQKPVSPNLSFQNSHYLSGNAVFALNKYFTLGGELLFGNLQNYDGTSGSAFRILSLIRLLF